MKLIITITEAPDSPDGKRRFHAEADVEGFEAGPEFEKRLINGLSDVVKQSAPQVARIVDKHLARAQAQGRN